MAMEMGRSRPYDTSTLRQAVNRLFEEALGSRAAEGGPTGFQSLPVNVWETAEGYQAALLAPGLDPQSLNVTMHEDTLSIEGELQWEVPEGARVIWQEFAPARFRRSLRLGAAVDPARVEALFQNGILLVTMPKAEHARPRQVQVQVAGAEPKA